MSFPVRLEVFEGPLGLLLHLISRQRLDVAEVSISTITDEYLKAIGELPEMDLEAATAFLVLAATLLELKSLKLLPVACPADPELAALLEERDLLLHRLIEYSAFKRAAGALAELLDENDGYHPR
ncbi:MAG: segregation and condensation protein A, partial [Candidatus Methylomirabilales bacterium]